MAIQNRALLGLLLLLSTHGLAADDWAQIRGPHRDGIAVNEGRILEWSADGPELLWSKSLGPGTSSAAISNGRLYTMGFRKGYEIVYCLNPNTGEEFWTFKYRSTLEPYLFEGGSRQFDEIDRLHGQLPASRLQIADFL